MGAGSLSLTALHDCLAGLEPAKLLGMDLLRQAHPASGQLPNPIPREMMVKAVSQIIAYTARCEVALDRVRCLSPVPLITLTQWEYGL